MTFTHGVNHTQLHVFIGCLLVNLRHRTILQIISSVRKIARNKTTKTEYQHRPEPTSHGCIELDTHANTTMLGSNCVVLSYTGKEYKVSPYSSQYEAVQNVTVVTGAMVWTNAADGTAYLLIFHESLWMCDKLDHTLVNPNQLRAYGVSVQDNPLPPMTPQSSSIRRGQLSVGTLGHQQNPCSANFHGSFLYPHMTGIPTTSASHLAMVSHLTAYQLGLITRYLQWTHYCNTQFMTPSWWQHSCRHMSRSLK